MLSVGFTFTWHAISVMADSKRARSAVSGYIARRRRAFSRASGYSMLFGDGKSRRFSSSLARFDSQLAAVLSWRRSLFPDTITHRRERTEDAYISDCSVTLLHCGGTGMALLMQYGGIALYTAATWHHRRQSIGVHGVRTPQFSALWCPPICGHPGLLTT